MVGRIIKVKAHIRNGSIVQAHQRMLEPWVPGDPTTGNELLSKGWDGYPDQSSFDNGTLPVMEPGNESSTIPEASRNILTAIHKAH